jgi:lipopolysaccharide assembly outer membrane protein LptD (OstA)
LQQEDVTFRGERVYVVLDNNAAMIEGGTDFQRPNLQITSDRVDYNWKTRIAEFKGNVKVIREGGLLELLDPVKYNVKTKEFVM